MATSEQHRAKWHSNRAFLATVAGDHPDWMIVVLFYSALHSIETLLSHDGARTSGGHTGRNQLLKRGNRYKGIWTHYRVLYDVSRTARYEPVAPNWMTVEHVRTRLAPRLYAIEQIVQHHVGIHDALKPVW